jgi:hypothetical protein
MHEWTIVSQGGGLDPTLNLAWICRKCQMTVILEVKGGGYWYYTANGVVRGEPPCNVQVLAAGGIPITPELKEKLARKDELKKRISEAIAEKKQKEREKEIIDF